MKIVLSLSSILLERDFDCANSSEYSHSIGIISFYVIALLYNTMSIEIASIHLNNLHNMTGISCTDTCALSVTQTLRNITYDKLQKNKYNK